MVERSEKSSVGKDEPQADPTSENQPSGGFAAFKRFFGRKWLLVLVIGSLAVHGAGFAYYRLREKPAPVHVSPEIPLGKFHFQPDRAEGGRITAAEFALHLALAEGFDQAIRQRLEDRQFRVRQQVEELLRKAHSGDFEDPDLQDLKRQMQQQVNETLGAHAVAEVVVTDLKLRREAGEKAKISAERVQDSMVAGEQVLD